MSTSFCKGIIVGMWFLAKTTALKLTLYLEEYCGNSTHSCEFTHQSFPSVYSDVGLVLFFSFFTLLFAIWPFLIHNRPCHIQMHTLNTQCKFSSLLSEGRLLILSSTSFTGCMSDLVN